MTPLSVSFRAILKAMNTVKFPIHVLLIAWKKALCKKMAGHVLCPKYFPANILMHLCTNDFNFRAYCRLGKSKNRENLCF